MKNRYAKILNEIESERHNQELLSRDDKVLIVDGTNMFIRTFSAIPTLNEEGIHVGGLSGFLLSLAATIRMVEPTRVGIVFDGKGGSYRRRQIYSNYKERRAINTRLNRIVGFDGIENENMSIRHQLFRVYSYLQNLPITTISIDQIEADDVIAYLSSYFKHKVVILSSDKDFLQLVSDRVNVYSPSKKKMYTPDSLFDEIGIWCENFIIYKSLLGDKSDNIEGIKGIGPKTIEKNFPMLSEKRKIDLEMFSEFCKLYDGKSKSINYLKDNIKILERNHAIMQLHEVDISQSHKSNIRNLVDGEIEGIKSGELNKLYIQDKLHSIIPNWDNWIKKNFTTLNLLRNKHAR
jgi:DNA polymerase-1